MEKPGDSPFSFSQHDDHHPSVDAGAVSYGSSSSDLEGLLESRRDIGDNEVLQALDQPNSLEATAIPTSVRIPTHQHRKDGDVIVGELAAGSLPSLGHIILSQRSSGMHARTDQFLVELDAFAKLLWDQQKKDRPTRLDVKTFRDRFTQDCVFWITHSGKLRKDHGLWKSARIRTAKNHEVNKSISEQIKGRLARLWKAGALEDMREEHRVTDVMDSSAASSSHAMFMPHRSSNSSSSHSRLRETSERTQGSDSAISSLSSPGFTTSSSSPSSKRRAVVRPPALNDDDCNQFVKHRFHPQFLQISTFQRFRRTFLGEEVEFCDDDETQVRLLRFLLENERIDQSGTWTRCSIPHIVIGADRSITAAVVRFCGDYVLAKTLYEDLKRNDYNQVKMGQILRLTSPLAPTDSSGWDPIVEQGLVLALPTVLTITRRYIDVSSRCITILFGPHMVHLSAIFIDGEERSADILHLGDLCHDNDVDLPTRDPVVVRTNDCLVLCSRHPMSAESVELEADLSIVGPVRESDLITRSKTYQVGELEGLVLGYHFQYATSLCAVASTCEGGFTSGDPVIVPIEKWRWTRYVCGVRKAPVAVEKIHELSIRNRWTDMHPEFLPWPITNKQTTRLL